MYLLLHSFGSALPPINCLHRNKREDPHQHSHMDTFNNTTKSIHDLLKRALYEIPDYQRHYKWEKRQVEELWSDLYKAFKEKKSSYFLGSIIVVKEKSNAREEVIDGHQRLVTITLLLATIKKYLQEAQHRSKKYLQSLESCIRKGSNHRVILTDSNHLGSHSLATVIASIEGGSIREPKGVRQKAYQNEHRFKKAACIFMKNIKKVTRDSQALNKFATFILKKVKVNLMVCPARDDAITLFQKLNFRGVKLEDIEIVKSQLMKNIAHDKESRKRFWERWTALEQKATKCNTTIADLFIIYKLFRSPKSKEKLPTYYEKSAEAEKNEDLGPLFRGKPADRREARKSQTEHIIAEVQKFADYYEEDLLPGKETNGHNDDNYALALLDSKNHWEAVLLTALHQKFAPYKRLKKLIFTTTYRYWIVGKNAKIVESISREFIKKIKERATIEALEAYVKKRSEEDSVTIKRLKATLEREACNRDKKTLKKWVKPLLAIIECSLEDNSKIINPDAEYHIEHILPIHYKEKEWPHLTKAIATKWQSRLGNLTLLHGRKNKKAKNKPFAQKVKIYQGSGDSGQMSAFELTKSIVKNYPIWDEQALKGRQSFLVGKAMEMLVGYITNTIKSNIQPYYATKASIIRKPNVTIRSNMLPLTL